MKVCSAALNVCDPPSADDEHAVLDSRGHGRNYCSLLARDSSPDCKCNESRQEIQPLQVFPRHPDYESTAALIRLYSGSLHLAAGLSVGLTGLAAGYTIGIVGETVCHGL